MWTSIKDTPPAKKYLALGAADKDRYQREKAEAERKNAAAALNPQPQQMHHVTNNNANNHPSLKPPMTQHSMSVQPNTLPRHLESLRGTQTREAASSMGRALGLNPTQIELLISPNVLNVVGPNTEVGESWFKNSF